MLRLSRSSRSWLVCHAVAVAALSGVMFGSAGVARAQDAGAPVATAGSGQPAWIVACAADIQKHCSAEMTANADVRPCLAKQGAALSQSCKDVFLRQYKMLEVCKADFDKICPGAASPKALLACVNEKQAQLSDPCLAALSRGNRQFKRAAAAAPDKADKPDKPDKAPAATPTKPAPAAKPAP